jgi:hypothetical protein
MNGSTTCPGCGAAVVPTAKFCRACGMSLTEQAASESPWEAARRADMTKAQEAYSALLADLQAGRIDETTFRRGVMANCVIARDDELWLMDSRNGRWLYYDGVEVRDLDAEG